MNQHKPFLHLRVVKRHVEALGGVTYVVLIVRGIFQLYHSERYPSLALTAAVHSSIPGTGSAPRGHAPRLYCFCIQGLVLFEMIE